MLCFGRGMTVCKHSGCIESFRCLEELRVVPRMRVMQFGASGWHVLWTADDARPSGVQSRGKETATGWVWVEPPDRPEGWC